MKKKQMILGAIALLALVGAGGALLFGARIRTALSMARSATMDETEITERAAENARTEEELQRRFDLAELAPDADLAAALQDGSMSLEEAAARLLEASGGNVPPVGQEAPSGSNPESAQSGGAASGSAAQGAPQETEPEQAAPQESAAQPEAESAAPQEAGPEQSAPQESAAQPEAESAAPQETQPEQAAPQETGQTSEAAAQPEAEPAAPETSEDEKRLKNLVAQMVLLRGQFTAKLENVIGECIAEYLALPEEERTTSNKMRVAYARLDEIADMEEDCDNQVAGIVAQIREIDPALADQVQQQYQNEKALKKASLIEQYS